MWVKWKLISIRLEAMLISKHDRCTVRIEHVIGLEIVLGAPLELLADVGQLEARFGLSRDSFNLSAR
jgi:hypothetical protein